MNERPIKEILQVFTERHIRRILISRKGVLLARNFKHLLQHPFKNILLKYSSRNAVKEGNDFGLQHFTDVAAAVQIIYNS